MIYIRTGVNFKNTDNSLGLSNLCNYSNFNLVYVVLLSVKLIYYLQLKNNYILYFSK